MAASQKNIDIVGEEDIGLSGEDITNMTENTRIFSLALRALYTHKVIDDKDDAAKFKDVRDKTAQCAIVYANDVLPKTTSFIRSLKDYFMNYTVPFDDWCKMIQSISNETKILITDVQTLLFLYRKIMGPLKECEDEARVISNTFHNLKKKFDVECEDYKREANEIENKYRFQILNRITYPSRKMSVEAKLDLAQKAKDRSEPHKKAAEIVDGTFFSKLHNFIGSLEKISGFFKVTEQDLISFKNAQEPENTRKMKQHYDNMNHGASGIKAACRIFFSSIPAVTSDLEALPNQDTDQKVVCEGLFQEGSAQREPKYVFLEMQPLEIPPPPKYVVLELRIPENPAELKQVILEIKKSEILPPKKHVMLEIKQSEIPAPPSYVTVEIKQSEIPPPKHVVLEIKQSLIAAPPNHVALEIKQSETAAPPKPFVLKIEP